VPKLTIRLLGEMQVLCDGAPQPLPQSKKTRALLAYLVVTARQQRRERLCDLLWDVTDDPRAALRWSLTKLRPLVDRPGAARIVADRESVRFDRCGAEIDIETIRDALRSGTSALATSRLRELVGAFRGEFLEGLELPDFHDFQAWCVAEREELRRLHRQVLETLIARTETAPEEALPYARALVQADPLSEAARAVLVRLLGAAGHRSEAAHQLAAANRMLAQLGSAATGELERAGASLRGSPGRPPAAESRTPTASSTAAQQDSRAALEQPDSLRGLVGRESEREHLERLLRATAVERKARIALLTGEPGVGKTRLLTELAALAGNVRATVLEGCAYEAEGARPYGPWVDALAQLPAVSVGSTLAGDLSLLLPQWGPGSEGERSRERLFGAIVELVASRAHSAPPVVLIFDDVQWCDDASAELLHYAVRMNRHRPVLVALAARDGELRDNGPMCRVLRALRRDGIVEEIEIGPMSREEIAKLIAPVAAAADASRIHEDCAGNPLLALELSRAAATPAARPAQSLREVVRDRVDRLPEAAADVLRWGAVFGRTFGTSRLGRVTGMSADDLVTALETLERHGLLKAAAGTHEPGGAYMFSHDVVRQVVYADLSQPRRRLMHSRFAHALHDHETHDESVAAELAYHAGLAGEPALAAHACVVAGRRCLRLFASSQAEALARRGRPYAAELPEPEQLKLTIDLLDVQLGARRPEQPEGVAAELEELAQRALDYGCPEHARIAFHLLSYLRWERGDWSSAQRSTMQAELVSRSGDEREHVLAMADAAFCLALIERDLVRAESMALEADARSDRLGFEAPAIPIARGMLHLHRGELDEAERLFREGCDLARREANHLQEFNALEQLVAIDMQRDRHSAALATCRELSRISERFREGSEIPFARVLEAVLGYAVGDEAAHASIEPALEALRVADAKHRLAFALTRTAELELQRGCTADAERHATEALAMAQTLGRASEIALAHAALARCAAARKDAADLRTHLQALRAVALGELSAQARAAAETALAQPSRKRTRRSA
jgi:DNA-binding SARP family transcriptional activator